MIRNAIDLNRLRRQRTFDNLQCAIPCMISMKDRSNYTVHHIGMESRIREDELAMCVCEISG